MSSDDMGLDKFTSAVRGFSKKTAPEVVAKATRAIALEALKRMVMKTPVDTGRARGGWQVAVTTRETFVSGLRRLPWPWFQTIYNDRQMLLSDDFYFCHTLNESNIQVWCDGSVRCSHYRTSDLLGHSLQEVLRGASRRKNVVDRFVRDATLADYLDRRQTEGKTT